MKIVVSGSRDWSDQSRIEKIFLEIKEKRGGEEDGEEIELIHGDCQGLDILAGKVAKKLGWKVSTFPAQWGAYGKSAGPIRNRQMLDQKPDLVIWFHDNISESKGTKDLLNEAKKRKLNILCGN